MAAPIDSTQPACPPPSSTGPNVNLTGRLAQALASSTPLHIEVMRMLRASFFTLTQNRALSVATTAQLGLAGTPPNIQNAWQLLTHWFSESDMDLNDVAADIVRHKLGDALPPLALVPVAPLAPKNVDHYVPPASPPRIAAAGMQNRVWREVITHWTQDTPPATFVMQILRHVLQHHTQDQAQSKIIEGLLDPLEAWATLKSWATNAGLTAEAVGQLYLASVNQRKVIQTVSAATQPATDGSPQAKGFAVAPAAVVHPQPGAASADTPSEGLAAVRDNERELMKQLRTAWTQNGVVPSVAVQRYLISLILNNHVVLTDVQAHAELGAIQQLLNANDSKKTAEAWEQLKPWVKRRAFSDMQLRLRLVHLAKPMSVQSTSVEDVRDLASTIHRNAYDVLMSLCEKVSAATRYPSAMPQEWLDSGKVSTATIARARLNDWQIVDLLDHRFIVPPMKLMQYLLSPSHYNHLVQLGILEAEGVPVTSSPTASFLDDFVSHLKRDLSRETVLADSSGRTLHVAANFKPGIITNETVLGAIAQGATLLNIQNELYLIPATAAVDGRLLLRLNMYGIIGLRGGPAAPWWPLRLEEEFKAADPFAALRESAAGMLDLPAFMARQRARWSGATIIPAIAMTDYPWVAAYPELSRWLSNHLSMVEPLDMKRIHAALTCAEQAHSVDTITVNMNMVKGVLGEIAIRPKIVAAYQRVLRQHPNAILAVAPQIYAGDVLEASDAMIFETVQQGQTAALHLLSVWEVTTHEGGVSAQSRQMDHSVFERYAQTGVHLRGNDGRGMSLPIDPLLSQTEMETRSVENSSELMAAVEATAMNVTTRFGQQEWQTNAHGGAINRGNDRAAKVSPHVEVAMSKAYTYEQFADALADADSAIATIFRNMTRPVGQRLMGIELEEIIPLSGTTISRWETLFEQICKTNGWDIAERNVKAAATSAGKQRQRAARPILEQAQKGAYATPQELYAALVDADPIGAAVLKNMTHPDGGTRASQKQLAIDNGVTGTTIQGREKQIDELCKDQKWEVVPMSGLSLSMHNAKTVSVAARKFITGAMTSSISLPEFRAQLSKIYPIVERVFENMVAPAGGIRLRPSTLETIVGIDNGLIGKWETLFAQLCIARGWSDQIRPLQSLADSTKASRQSHSRQKLLGDLHLLSELHDGRPLTATDFDPALGVASAKKYAEVFGSVDAALIEAGLIPNTKTPSTGERGFATADVLFLPQYAAQRLWDVIPTPAKQVATTTAHSGATMYLGQVGADVIDAVRTGDWSRFKTMSPAGEVRDLGAVMAGGELGRFAMSAAVAPIPISVMPLPLKGLAVRAGSLAAGVTLLNALRTGELRLNELPKTIVTTFGATASVKFATMILSQSRTLCATAEFLKLSRAGRATFLGGVFTAVAEFTVMREIQRKFFRDANRPNIEKVKKYAAQLIQADILIRQAREAGESVDPKIASAVRLQLKQLAEELKRTPDIDEQIATAQFEQDRLDLYNAKDLAIQSGVTASEADWNMTKELRRLERKHDSEVASIREKLSQQSVVSLRAAQEFQPEDIADAGVPLPGDTQRITQESTKLRSVHETLGHSWGVLALQMEEYLGQTRSMAVASAQ